MPYQSWLFERPMDAGTGRLFQGLIGFFATESQLSMNGSEVVVDSVLQPPFDELECGE